MTADKWAWALAEYAAVFHDLFVELLYSVVPREPEVARHLPEIVRAMQTHGWDVNEVSEAKYGTEFPIATALTLACSQCEPVVVSALLRAGADPNLAGTVHSPVGVAVEFADRSELHKLELTLDALRDHKCDMKMSPAAVRRALELTHILTHVELHFATSFQSPLPATGAAELLPRGRCRSSSRGAVSFRPPPPPASHPPSARCVRAGSP